jgi:DNA-binding XRE family transcriptional regulator
VGCLSEPVQGESVERARRKADAEFRAVEMREGESWLKYVHEWDACDVNDPVPWWEAGLGWIRTLLEPYVSVLSKVMSSPTEFQGELEIRVKMLASEVYDNKVSRYTQATHMDAKAGFIAFAQRRLHRVIKDEIATAWEREANKIQGRCRPRPNDFGKNVERLRLERGLTIDDLAEKSGVNAKTIIQCVKNRTVPHPGTKKKLADALETTIAHLNGDRH